MQRLISYVFLVCVTVGLQILVMMRGWGLHPQSWWWIIGVGVVGTTVIRTLFDAVEKEAKREDKEKLQQVPSSYRKDA